MLMPVFSLSADKFPLYSLDFESGSTTYLSMADGDVGAFDTAKFAISAWVKRESTGSAATILSQWSGGAQCAFKFGFDNSDAIAVTLSSNGTATNGRIVTNATYTSTANWYHILVHVDTANSTAGDRIRLFVDGVEVTSFATDSNPSAAVFDSTADFIAGRTAGFGEIFDGLIYQLAFFSGTLPDISSVYSSGAPKDVSGIPGLFLYLDTEGNSVVSDGVKATDWTNNNTVVTSSTKP